MWIPKLFQKQAPNDTNDSSFLFKDKNTGIIGYLNKNRMFETLTGLSDSILKGLNNAFNPSENNPFATLDDLDALGGSIIDVTAKASRLTNYTYDNGVDGVGATITFDSNGAFPTQDGVTSVLGNTYLLDSQVPDTHNGVWELTTLGDGSTQAVLTLSTLADEAEELYPLKVFISQGFAFKNFTYAQKTVDPVIGTDSIVFEQIRTNTSSTTQNILLADTATSTAITGLTYTPGTLANVPGYGATISKAGAFPTLNSVTPFINMKFLLKDETGADEYMNGLYVLTLNNGTSWSATRFTLTGSNINKKVICISNSTSDLYGDFYACDNTNTSSANIGTTAISFSEISAGALDKNIATNDLVFTIDSLTDFNDKIATFDNINKIIYQSNYNDNSSKIIEFKDSSGATRVSQGVNGSLALGENHQAFPILGSAGTGYFEAARIGTPEIVITGQALFGTGFNYIKDNDAYKTYYYAYHGHRFFNAPGNNTSGDIIWQISNEDGSNNILKVTGDKALTHSGGSFDQNTSDYNLYHRLTSTGQHFFEFNVPGFQTSFYMGAGGLFQISSASNLNLLSATGKYKFSNLPSYGSDALADADTDLPSGGFYKITGSRVISQKP